MWRRVVGRVGQGRKSKEERKREREGEGQEEREGVETTTHLKISPAVPTTPLIPSGLK